MTTTKTNDRIWKIAQAAAKEIIKARLGGDTNRAHLVELGTLRKIELIRAGLV